MMTPIPIHCLGLSHHNTPLDQREAVRYTPEKVTAALTDHHPQIRELAILSTCNRTELYAVLSPEAEANAVDAMAIDATAVLTQLLAHTTYTPLDQLPATLYHYQSWTAANHLCRVAAGLESQLLGEPQILGQVAQASHESQQQQRSGTTIAPLFRAAIRAGKRARTETPISRNAMSISATAVQTALHHLGTLANRHILIVGAGEMAQLALKALAKHPTGQLTIANRNHQRAQTLARDWQAQAITLDQLPHALTQADLVITATGAPHMILTEAMVTTAMQARSQKPLLLIDIAVPRDINPAVANIPHVTLFDMDQVRQQADEALQRRQQAIPQVEAIINAELDHLATTLRQAEVRPLITDLRQQAETIRQRELARTLRHLPTLDPAVQQHIEYLSQSLVNKLLHEPTTRLRTEAGQGRAEDYTQTVRYLFGLQPEPTTVETPQQDVSQQSVSQQGVSHTCHSEQSKESLKPNLISAQNSQESSL